MKTIPLTQGKVALVSDEDFEAVSQRKWHAMKTKNTFYASTTVTVSFKKKKHLFLHRFLLGDDSEHIDHIDGDGLNNQRWNLRPCSLRQNCFNRAPQKHCSLFKGVHRSGTSRWMARIEKGGKRYYLGCFGSDKVAAIAYDFAAMKLFGEFARTNFLGRTT